MAFSNHNDHLYNIYPRHHDTFDLITTTSTTLASSHKAAFNGFAITTIIELDDPKDDAAHDRKPHGNGSLIAAPGLRLLHEQQPHSLVNDCQTLSSIPINTFACTRNNHSFWPQRADSQHRSLTTRARRGRQSDSHNDYFGNTHTRLQHRTRRTPHSLMALVARDRDSVGAFQTSPESPPDLTSSSKSSKSSSFRTSGSSLSGDSQHDLSHFEDISLDRPNSDGVLSIGGLYGVNAAAAASDVSLAHDDKYFDVSRFRHGSALTLPPIRSSIASRVSLGSTATLTATSAATGQPQREPASPPPKPDLRRSSTTGLLEGGATARALRHSQSALHLTSATAQRRQRRPPPSTLTNPGYPIINPRSRSPSPTFLQSFGIVTGPPQQPRLPRRTSSRSSLQSATKTITPPVRRGSWQPGRKTVQELEDEYHDSDEEVDDDAIIWNVPLSATSSKPTSFPPAHAVDVGPTPLNVPMPRESNFTRTQTLPKPETGSLHNLRRQRSTPLLSNGTGPLLRSRPWNSRGPSPRSPSILQPPYCNATSPLDAYKSRQKSWTDALDDLSTEARHLTAALEAHQRSQSQAVAINGPRSPTANLPPSLSPAESSKTLTSPAVSPVPLSPSSIVTASDSFFPALHPSVSHSADGKPIVTLPPVRKSDLMVDPLPPSKEKTSFLTRTRPSWLPPKDKKEEKKHLREWKRMMQCSADADRKRAARLSAEAEAKAAQEESLKHIWQAGVLADWQSALAEPKTREMWWRGVPAELRADVWTKAIGNELQLSDASFYAALERGKAEARSLGALAQDGVELKEKEAEKWRAWSTLERDVDALGKESEWTRFATDEEKDADGNAVAGCRWQLVNVLTAYAAYRSDVGYVPGLAFPAALLLVAGLKPPDAFCAMANLFNRPVAMSYLVTSLRQRFEERLDEVEDVEGGNINNRNQVGTGTENSDSDEPRAIRPIVEFRASVLQVLATKFPALHTHLLATLKLDAAAFVDALAARLLADPRMGLAALLRTWDVMVFEGEKVLLRGVAAVLGRLEGRLLVCGSGREALALVGWNGGEEWGVFRRQEGEREMDAWMGALREVGRVERKMES